MKAKSLLGALAGVVLAGAMVAGAEPRGPQGMDREGSQPPAGPQGAMMDRQGPMMPPPMGHPPMGLDVERAKKAGATDAQIQTLTDFEFEQQSKRIDLQAAADKANLKLGYLLKAQAVDEKAVMQAVDALNQVRGELFKLGIVSLLKEKQVLGADLIQKLHEREPRGKMAPGMPGRHGCDKAPTGLNDDMRPPVDP